MFNLENLETEELKTLIHCITTISEIAENRETLETGNTYELLSSATNELKLREDKLKKGLLDPISKLNDFWAKSYICIKSKSPSGYNESRYFKISKIDRNPYGLETEVAAYTKHPELVVIERDGKLHYEIRYLKTIDRSTQESIIDGFSSLEIKKMINENSQSAKETYVKIYTAAVDYYANLDLE